VKEREHKKFVMYSLYAWGSPFIMLLVCMAMDLVPGVPSEYIKPDFGAKKCWFSSKYAETCLTGLTRWNTVLLKKPRFVQMVKKLRTFYETRRFITVFTRSHQGLYPEPDEPTHIFFNPII
jgi:hypothetical protein